MKMIDKIHLKYPFYGSRRIKDELNDQGVHVNRKRIQRLMRKMGLSVIYPRPRTTYSNKENRVYPYLLRNKQIDKPNQVWASDITYIPMEKSFLYLVVIMDWYSRKILSWRLSNSLDTEFCIDALEEAIFNFGVPEVFNSDQGVQYSSERFTDILKDYSVQISMDGKGAWTDNVFVERLWRSVKYEEVYLKAYDTVKEAKTGIGDWIEFYNTKRRHQSLDSKTPDMVFFDGLNQNVAA